MSDGSGDAYRAAGVDIEAGEAVVRGIRAAVQATWKRGGVISDLGGFGGLFAPPKVADPVLVSGTDGVGTKLLVAQRVGRHDTVGVDLVAMCVNDVLVTGAEPLFFLDYFATGKLAPEVAVEVVRGIAAGCEQAGCALIGGETAEMPGMYAPGHYDLAGFCVGIADRSAILRPAETTRGGDVLVGLPSSGLHSNGFSLVRRIVDDLDWSAPFDGGAPLGEVLLTPTRIYSQEILGAARAGRIRGAAHITGGGFLENIPRILPAGLGARIDLGAWRAPAIFELLADRGALSQRDLFRTFNMGVGMIAPVAPDDVAAVRALWPDAVTLGEVIPDAEGAVHLNGAWR